MVNEIVKRRKVLIKAAKALCLAALFISVKLTYSYNCFKIIKQ